MDTENNQNTPALITVHDAATGETVTREMTPEELAEMAATLAEVAPAEE